MKWSNVLFGIASFAVAVSARGIPFQLQVENSLYEPLNGLYLEDSNGAGVLDAGAETVTAVFDDTPPFYLYGNDGTTVALKYAGEFEETLSFLPVLISETRTTEFHIIDGYLTYGDEADKFYAFPASSGTGWTVRWIKDGAIVTADGFAIDLKAIF